MPIGKLSRWRFATDMQTSLSLYIRQSWDYTLWMSEVVRSLCKRFPVITEIFWIAENLLLTIYTTSSTNSVTAVRPTASCGWCRWDEKAQVALWSSLKLCSGNAGLTSVHIVAASLPLRKVICVYWIHGIVYLSYTYSCSPFHSNTSLGGWYFSLDKGHWHYTLAEWRHDSCFTQRADVHIEIC